MLTYSILNNIQDNTWISNYIQQKTVSVIRYEWKSKY